MRLPRSGEPSRRCSGRARERQQDRVRQCCWRSQPQPVVRGGVAWSGRAQSGLFALAFSCAVVEADESSPAHHHTLVARLPCSSPVFLRSPPPSLRLTSSPNIFFSIPTPSRVLVASPYLPTAGEDETSCHCGYVRIETQRHHTPRESSPTLDWPETWSPAAMAALKVESWIWYAMVMMVAASR